jgi:hypothetical protein
MELVVVERVYERPLTDQDLVAAVRRAGPCFSIRRIRRVQTILSKDRLRSICLYEAPDASVVRDVHDQEQLPYAKIWSADTLDLSSLIGASPASE